MRRVLGVILFVCLFTERSAFAQLAPTGSHYAGRVSDTGHQSVTATGGFPASVALDFPAARGGIGIPVSLTHGRRGFGAGGLGWDVPLSFVRRDDTVSRRRPARLPGGGVKALAQQTGSSWYRYWKSAGITRRTVDRHFGRAFHQAVKRADRIHFTLDGIPDAALAVRRGASGFTLGNFTNAELHYIASDFARLAKTTFYRLGQVVPSPF